MSANKRMFSKDVVESDKFLDLPFNSQLLYFHLGINGDLRGFVEPKRVIRMVGLKPEDLRPLVENGFVLLFDGGVIVITHWKVNNNLREDREAETRFLEEFERLGCSNSEYQLLEYSRSTPVQLPPRIGKDRIGKDRIDNICAPSLLEFTNKFNELFNKSYRPTKGREQKLKGRLKSFSMEQIMVALENMAKDKFYGGTNDRGWIADPDFLLRNDEQIDRFLNHEKKKKLVSVDLNTGEEIYD
jgi:hypothetical protein